MLFLFDKNGIAGEFFFFFFRKNTEKQVFCYFFVIRKTVIKRGQNLYAIAMTEIERNSTK